MKIKLSANENFPRAVVEELRKLDYEVITSLEVVQANQGIPDDEVLTVTSNQRSKIQGTDEKVG